MYAKIKLLIVIVSITLIGLGWIIQNFTIATIGAIFYLTGMLYDLGFLIIKSKEFKNKKEIEPQKEQQTVKEIIDLLDGVLVISSLIAMCFKNDLYRVPGGIIWFGQILVFILVGPIVATYANIPMHMTYGGWRPRKFRKRRR
jgi:hypothetical protein